MPETLDPSKTGPAAQKLRDDLERTIVGQPEAIEHIVRLYQNFNAGMAGAGRPLGSLLFLGPTGAGKTKSVEATAESLIGTAKSLIKIDCAEFQHSHEVAKLIGCFARGTKVQMMDGSMKCIEDIQVHDFVISGIGTPEPVIDTHSYKYEGEMVKLSVANSNTPVICTPDHKVWAIRNPTTPGERVRDPKSLYDAKKLEWVPAGELCKKDVVVWPRFGYMTDNFTIDLAAYAEQLPGGCIIEDEWVAPYNKYLNVRGTKIRRFIEVDEDFARFAGYYVAEGGNSKDRGSINFTPGVPHKQCVVDDLYRLIPAIFNPENIRDECHIREEDRSDRNTVRLVFCSQIVAAMMADKFGEHTLVKRVPEFFMELGKDILWEFVDAAIACDGGLSEPRRVDYSTSSPVLHEQMNYILRSRLGVITQKQSHPSTKEGWAPRYRTYVAGAQISDFASHLPMCGPKIDLSGERYAGIQRMAHVDKEFIYMQLTGVERVPYNDDVFDISVSYESSYITEFKVSNSPPGYLGHRETHPLLSQEVLNQYHTDKVKISIVLFDEIEKASNALWNLLLGILDKATLTLGDNRRVDFSRALIFLTSNLGAAEMNRLVSPGMGFSLPANAANVSTDKITKTGIESARRNFTPEFINRLDSMVVFRTLTQSDIDRIFSLELAAIQQRVFTSTTTAPFVFRLTDAARTSLLKNSADNRYGARHIKRTLERLLVNPLSNLISSEQIHGGDMIEVDVDAADQLVFRKMEENLPAMRMIQELADANVVLPGNGGSGLAKPVEAPDPKRSTIPFAKKPRQTNKGTNGPVRPPLATPECVPTTVSVETPPRLPDNRNRLKK